MGTPHSKGANDELWRNVAIIPKTSLKRFSKHALTSEEAAIFGNISRQFETIEPPIPILSTYETRATRIRGGGIGVLQVKNTLVGLLLVPLAAMLTCSELACQKRIFLDTFTERTRSRGGR
jgi:hypothetical protein